MEDSRVVLIFNLVAGVVLLFFGMGWVEVGSKIGTLRVEMGIEANNNGTIITSAMYIVLALVNFALMSLMLFGSVTAKNKFAKSALFVAIGSVLIIPIAIALSSLPVLSPIYNLN